MLYEAIRRVRALQVTESMTRAIRDSLYVSLSLASVFVLERRLSQSIDLSILYLGVVVAAGYFGSRWAVCIACLGAAALHMEAVEALHPSMPGLLFTNQILRTLSWVAIGSLVALLRGQILTVAKQRDQLKEVREQRTLALDTARKVQSGIIPQRLPADHRFELAAAYIPASELGGDFYDACIIGNSLCILVADVSGKGPAAALGTAVLRGLFDGTRQAAQPVAPGECLRSLNRKLCEYLPEWMFVTCFYGVLDLATGHFNYASAGHDPAFHYSSAAGQVSCLDSTGFPLGIEVDANYEERFCLLQEKDLLVLYSDGLTDARVSQGRLGSDSVQRFIRDSSGGAVRCEWVVNALIALAPSIGGSKQHDDVVVLGLRYSP